MSSFLPSLKDIVIVMSDRAPLKIRPDEWPILAETISGPDRVLVREHRDGRRLVYGLRDEEPPRRGGFLVPRREAPERSSHSGGQISAPDSDGTIRAIRRVAGILGNKVLGDECIADLPEEELS